MRALIVAATVGVLGCGEDPIPGGWANEFVFTRSGDSCSEWADPPTPTERGIPEGAVVGQLWRWHAYDDPLYGETGLANQLIADFAVAPGDLIWVIGPEPERVMALDARTARLRWISEPFTGQLREPMAAPDGSLFVQVLEEGAFPARAVAYVRITPDFEVTGWPMPGTSSYPRLLIGPHGRVYVSVGDEIIATCQGGFTLWKMEVRRGPRSG